MPYNSRLHHRWSAAEQRRAAEDAGRVRAEGPTDISAFTEDEARAAYAGALEWGDREFAQQLRKLYPWLTKR